MTKLRLACATLLVVQLVSTAAVHSLFACTTFAHPRGDEPAAVDSEHAHHATSEEGAAPVCCRQPTTVGGIQASHRLDQGSVLMPSTFDLPIVASSPVIVASVQRRGAPTLHGPPIRTHLLISTLLL